MSAVFGKGPSRFILILHIFLPLHVSFYFAHNKATHPAARPFCTIFDVCRLRPQTGNYSPTAPSSFGVGAGHFFPQSSIRFQDWRTLSFGMTLAA